ncbi:MAG: HAD family hydrolase [Candidatus Krumholzibacteriia bacterium]
MTAYRCLILDLDGTVVDSHAYTFAAFRHACAPFRTPPGDARIYAAFGPDESIILRSLVGATHAAEAYRRLQEYYAAHVDSLVVHAEMRALLGDCARGGIRRGLFTGRGSDSTRLILSRLHLEHCFEAVVAGDTVRQPKPAADGVVGLLRELGCAPSEAVVVGDSVLDVEAARRAGTSAALATWFTCAVTRADSTAPQLERPDALRPLLGLPSRAAGG